MPNQPLKEGERKGEVEVEIDGYVIQFKFTAKSPKAKLTIFDKTGAPQKEPRKLFNKLFGVNDFDIDSFLSLSPAKKTEKIKNLSGIDWADADAIYKEKFEQRTYQKRKAEELDAKIDDDPYNPELKEIDTVRINERVEKAVKANNDIIHIKNGVKSAQDKINDLFAEQEAIEEEIKEHQSKVAKGEKWLEGKEVQSIEGIQEELNQAIEHNKSVARNEEVGKLRAESVDIWKEVEDLTIDLEAIRQQKAEQLEASDMPVEGMTIEDGELFLNGLPFESDQINTAKRIIAGLQIQFAINKAESQEGDERVSISCFDGSLLDNDSIKEVEQWATENGVQLFVEMVDRNSDELKIEINES